MKSNTKRKAKFHKYGKSLILLPFVLILFFVISKWTTKDTVVPVDPVAIEVKELLPKSAEIQKTPELNMVFVEGGSFMMGCTNEQGDDCKLDERPAHQVTVPNFYIGKYRVTNQEFVPFLNAKGNNEEGNGLWVKLDGNSGKVSCGIKKTNGNYLVKPGHEKLPMIYVSWYGARAYADWLKSTTGKNYRLPSESEWEYAARGGKKTQSYKFAGSDIAEEVGWNWNNSEDHTHPVGSAKKGNELGIYDMSGNVQDWVEDCYSSDYNETPIDGSAFVDGKCSTRVLRSCGWDYKALYCRISDRTYNYPKNRSEIIGFRLVYSEH